MCKVGIPAASNREPSINKWCIHNRFKRHAWDSSISFAHRLSTYLALINASASLQKAFNHSLHKLSRHYKYQLQLRSQRAASIYTSSCLQRPVAQFSKLITNQQNITWLLKCSIDGVTLSIAIYVAMIVVVNACFWFSGFSMYIYTQPFIVKCNVHFLLTHTSRWADAALMDLTSLHKTHSRQCCLGLWTNLAAALSRHPCPLISPLRYACRGSGECPSTGCIGTPLDSMRPTLDLCRILGVETANSEKACVYQKDAPHYSVSALCSCDLTLAHLWLDSQHRTHFQVGQEG